uniref:Glycoside hydrolase family 38 C-terminal domain-containing protein n=1 Tax=Roseihalotalea indica TaxID=2867963 RepID=A0AA49GJ49_9BACT|nr:glycoside hydrolase family 38 C-terminal domain-containing protein [Tunicatimonas sp. TK19036]
MSAQQAYFIDGYHGGIYGHFPRWQTQFMVDQLEDHPDWKVNLEIEPETWDSVKVYDPEAYQRFKEALNDPAIAERIEFVNPGYGQSYLYNISGESLIRQFEYGIRKINEHFPSAQFTTYSTEEPCFTSALPQVLNSFGFQYASLKNPNTCWGGYTRGYGNGPIDWIGPDGTAITTIPRYAAEQLEGSSTWQTTAWANSEDYIQACLEAGIKDPIGMCLQDAGWDGGPWLGIAKRTYQPSEYTTWRDYFEDIAPEATQAWNFSQEDIQVSLMWGSQVLQKLAQQVRVAENKIVMAEKLAALSSFYRPMSWPTASLDEAWRTLLLAQHHDCWIVPYNGRVNDTWADKVVVWTDTTNQTSDRVMQQAAENLASSQSAEDKQHVRVFNTLLAPRSEIASVTIPDGWGNADVSIADQNGKPVVSQVINLPGENKQELLFLAEVPSTGYATYSLKKAKPASASGATIRVENNGIHVLETDLYKITIDPRQGGSIKSLIAKKMDDREFVDQNNERHFNEIRGFFFEKEQFYSSADQAARIKILENGPLMVRLQIEGKIDVHPYSQIITLRQGDKKIDFDLTIDWQGNPGIGHYSQAENYEATDLNKAFYNDQYKLLTLFPLNLESQKVYKNAPFDVTESQLDNTFFNRWDSIKHNIVVNWVDVTNRADQYGLALFTDHTTSYTHGTNHPLGLNLQYSGKGLWGRDYKITGPSQVHYAIVPHQGTWKDAGIWTESTKWNEPLYTTLMDSPSSQDQRSLIETSGQGWEVTTMLADDRDLTIRLFNAEASDKAQKITIDGRVQTAELVALNGQVIENLEIQKQGDSQSTISLAIPHFGIRTIRLGLEAVDHDSQE